MSFQATSKTGVNPFATQASNIQKAKPRGGWDDEDDSNDLFTNPNIVSFTGSNVTQLVKPSLNIATGSKIFTEPAKVIDNGESDKKLSILTCDEAFFNNHAHEFKIINELIQPGGARLKQTDMVLNDFCKACDSLQIDIVGSLLLNNLTGPAAFVSKAKSLYLIEALVKKLKKYNGYFNHNQKALASYNFAEEGNMNATQLKKIRDDIINHLKGQVRTPQVHQQQQVATPMTAMSSSKQLSAVSQPQSAQVYPVSLSTTPVVTAAKQGPTVTVQSSIPHAQPQSNNFQVPLTAQLPSQTKLNPFGITKNAGPNSAAIPKPSSGLPGAFKNKLNKNQEAVPVSPSSALSQDSIPTPASAQPQNLLSNQINPQQAIQNPQQPINSVINSMAGLSFNEPEVHQNFNGQEVQQNFNGFNVMHPNQYAHNEPKFGQMQYPVCDQNMMAYPGPGQYNYPSQAPYNYPNPQFNGQFNTPYNNPQQFQPQYNSQFQGQYPPYYDPYMNHQMQTVPQQGQMYYQEPTPAHNDHSELIDSLVNQPDPEQEEAKKEELRKKEQQRLEEIKRKKQQEENEKRFECLNYLM